MSNDCQTRVTLTRGTTMHVEATFFDAFDLPARPNKVEITFNFVAGGQRQSASFPMVFNLFTGIWVYDWDTTGKTPGEVFFSIRSDPDTSPAYAGDGSFKLSANQANFNAAYPLP